MGSLAQISSCAIRCSFNTSFRRVLVQILVPREVPEGFRCRYLVRFWKFPVQVLGEVPEGYGADTWLRSRGFWCRYLVRFRKFAVQLPDEVPEGL